MARPNAKKLALFGGVPTFAIGCMFVAWWVWAVDIDPLLERKCHNAVANSTPFDLRDIATLAYSEQGAELGIARGRLETRYSASRWAEVGWRCRVNPRSGQVFRVEIEELQGVQRLKAAATPFKVR